VCFLKLANDFRVEFENLVRPIEHQLDKLTNFKNDLCAKIDLVQIELKKLKKGAILTYHPEVKCN